jgi:hypothetical protein
MLVGETKQTSSISNSVFHYFQLKGSRKSKTIVGEIPTADFTLFLIFVYENGRFK